MGEVKQINIKNGTYYFYNDIIDVKGFDSILLKIDWRSYKNIGIYNIEYITIKKNWWLWKYLQSKSFAFDYCSCKRIYWRKKAQINSLWLYRWKQRVTKKIQWWNQRSKQWRVWKEMLTEFIVCIWAKMMQLT